MNKAVKYHYIKVAGDVHLISMINRLLKLSLHIYNSMPTLLVPLNKKPKLSART